MYSSEREKERDLKHRLGRVPRYGSVGGAGAGPAQGPGLGDDDNTYSHRSKDPRGDKGTGSNSGPPKSAGGNERSGRGGERMASKSNQNNNSNNGQIPSTGSGHSGNAGGMYHINSDQRVADEARYQ